jgi:hypothetical protein
MGRLDDDDDDDDDADDDNDVYHLWEDFPNKGRLPTYGKASQ